MVLFLRGWLSVGALASGAAALALISGAGKPAPDQIGDLIKRAPEAAQPAKANVIKVADSKATAAAEATPPSTPKAGEETDASREQAQRLMKAIESILQDTARNRSEARKLPTENDYIVRPIWTETREDRE